MMRQSNNSQKHHHKNINGILTTLTVDSLYGLKLFVTNLSTKDDFPTPVSPSKTTCKKDLISSFKGIKLKSNLYFTRFPFCTHAAQKYLSDFDFSYVVQ